MDLHYNLQSKLLKIILMLISLYFILQNMIPNIEFNLMIKIIGIILIIYILLDYYYPTVCCEFKKDNQ